MSRSQHIIAAGVKQEHHPPMSSETRIFFLGLDFFFAHSCLAFQNSSFCGSANQRRAKFASVWRRTGADPNLRSWFVENPDSVSVGGCVEMSVKSLDAVKRKIQCLQQQADDAQDRAQFLQTQLDNERDLREKVRKHLTFPSLFLSLSAASAVRAFRSSLDRNGGDRGMLSHFTARCFSVMLRTPGHVVTLYCTVF